MPYLRGASLMLNDNVAGASRAKRKKRKEIEKAQVDEQMRGGLKTSFVTTPRKIIL